ncbi:hypothetical protein [Paludisphaera sp.]|uniref:hypothetical protein n=1 Tax=Paludisphaera sp. TaxID=2017432 RepID=UPI00301C368F
MDEPRAISEKDYRRLVFLLSGLIALGTTIASREVARLCGARINGGSLAGMTLLYLALARNLAEHILRRRGLTLRGTAVEIYARSPSEPAMNVGAMERVEARLPNERLRLLLIGAPFWSLFLLAGGWFLFEGDPWLRRLSFGMSAFFLVCWIVSILDYGKPLAWVDAEGVTGYPSQRMLVRRFVPWSDVYRCEVETSYDTFGEPFLPRPILKGRGGETLMKLHLACAPMDEQERIVEAIKARLPETEVDAWPA